MEVTVKDRQSLLDIAVQSLGGIEGVFALAERNNISITDRLADGTVLLWEHSDTVNANIQKTYALRGLFPATEIESKEMNVLLNETNDATLHEDRRPRPQWSEIWGDSIETEKTQQILKQLQSGEEYVPTSDLSLTRIFDNPFDIVFA